MEGVALRVNMWRAVCRCLTLPLGLSSRLILIISLAFFSAIYNPAVRPKQINISKNTLTVSACSERGDRQPQCYIVCVCAAAAFTVQRHLESWGTTLPAGGNQRGRRKLFKWGYKEKVRWTERGEPSTWWKRSKLEDQTGFPTNVTIFRNQRRSKETECLCLSSASLITAPIPRTFAAANESRLTHEESRSFSRSKFEWWEEKKSLWGSFSGRNFSLRLRYSRLNFDIV